jgi:hypothetical protein
MAWTDWIGGFRRSEFPRFLRKTKRRQRRLSQRERHRAAVRLETLESRLLLAFEPVSPLGSLIYQDRWWADFETSTETDSFAVELDAGQTLAGAVVPGDGGIRASIEIVDPVGVSLGVFDAAEAGQPAVFQTLAVADAGVYQIDVTSLEGTGPYSVQLLLNAAGEEESYTGASNDTWETAQDIEGSFLALGGAGQRGAVLGDLPTGASDVDWYAFSLAENQGVSLSVTGQGAGSFTLDLYDAAGERLATGIAPGPRGNVDQRIAGYQAPSAGTYYAVVSGAGEYSLVISRDMALDVEPNTRPGDAQWLSPAQAGVGSLGRMEEGGAVGTIRVALLRNSYMSADVQLADSTEFDFQPVLVGASQIDTVEELNAFDVVVIGDQSSRTTCRRSPGAAVVGRNGRRRGRRYGVAGLRRRHRDGYPDRRHRCHHPRQHSGVLWLSWKRLHVDGDRSEPSGDRGCQPVFPYQAPTRSISRSTRAHACWARPQ